MTMAQLHTELVSPGAAARWLVMTHGMFGSGGNWRSIARALVARRPEWGVILVDLRLHGRSTGGDEPHTVAACADDVLALVRLQDAQGRPVEAVCGHSFGGKVMLQVRERAPSWLRQTWVLDASPSARPEEFSAEDSTVLGVLNLLEQAPRHWLRRELFIEHVVTRGYSRALAQWLAMNLEPAEEGLRLRLDPPALRMLLGDYHRVDLWSAVEDDRLPGTVHLVIAEQSTTVSSADRARLQRAGTSTLHVHVLPRAGHWLHIDAPTAVVDLLATHLETTRSA
jgi:pimeloyl-ACP methyl ester carboxylesterase